MNNEICFSLTLFNLINYTTLALEGIQISLNSLARLFINDAQISFWHAEAGPVQSLMVNIET